MALISDIGDWVIDDMLARSVDSDLRWRVYNSAISFYTLLCDKVPFDELQVTSPEQPMVAGVDTYAITATQAEYNAVMAQYPTTGIYPWLFSPAMRAIANIRITFDSQTRRRLRRSHVRVYDSLSFSANNKTATYARWDSNIQVSPPPDSSLYTMRFRYWQRIDQMSGSLGLPPFVVTAGSWSSGSTTLTLSQNGVPSVAGISVGDFIKVSGVQPYTYNGSQFQLSGVNTGASTVTYPQTSSPGTYVANGRLLDLTSAWYRQLLTPPAWDELMRWETLYRAYHLIDAADKAATLVQGQYPPARMPGSPKQQRTYEMGIIPKLWNDLLTTTSSKENVDEDFNINPVIRAYSVR